MDSRALKRCRLKIVANIIETARLLTEANSDLCNANERIERFDEVMLDFLTQLDNVERDLKLLTIKVSVDEDAS